MVGKSCTIWDGCIKPCKEEDKLPFPQLVSRISEPSLTVSLKFVCIIFPSFQKGLLYLKTEIAFNAVLWKKNATLPGIVAPKDRIAPLRIAWRCGAYFVGGMIGDPKYFILDM